MKPISATTTKPFLIPSLLVSVRTPAEAEVALAGGAAMIDVKEPSRGSLGRADDETVTAVLHCVKGRSPISAALGELMDRPNPFSFPGLSYVKWGVAGCSNHPHWPEAMAAARHSLQGKGCQGVVAAYVDWRRAEAPPPWDVFLQLCKQDWAVFLLDTWKKDGSTLLDWMGTAEIREFCSSCRALGVRIALAGSLGRRELIALRSAGPNWFAVRGAACAGGQRQGSLEAEAVQRLVRALSESGA
jgi:uncharacterized protein (UPF0264 family)